VSELVAETCVTRLVIDLRCHATESGYQFGRAVLKLSAVIDLVIRPLLRAHLEKLPNAAALSPPALARTVLVVLHCCDVSGTSFQRLLSALRREEPLFVFEFITFGRPLLLGDFSLVLPLLLPSWANLLCHAPLPEMLASVLSDFFVRAYLPQVLLPDPDSDGFVLLPLRPALPSDPLRPAASLSVAFPSRSSVPSVAASSIVSPGPAASPSPPSSPPLSPPSVFKRARLFPPSSCAAASFSAVPSPFGVGLFPPSVVGPSAAVSSLPSLAPPAVAVSAHASFSAAASAVPVVAASGAYLSDRQRGRLLVRYLDSLPPAALSAFRLLPLSVLLAQLNSVLPELHAATLPLATLPAPLDPASFVTEAWLRASRRLWSYVRGTSALPPSVPSIASSFLAAAARAPPSASSSAFSAAPVYESISDYSDEE